MLPRLIAKNQSDPVRMGAVLQLVQTMKLELYLELRKTTVSVALSFPTKRLAEMSVLVVLHRLSPSVSSFACPSLRIRESFTDRCSRHTNLSGTTSPNNSSLKLPPPFSPHP